GRDQPPPLTGRDRRSVEAAEAGQQTTADDPRPASPHEAQEDTQRPDADVHADEHVRDVRRGPEQEPPAGDDPGAGVADAVDALHPDGRRHQAGGADRPLAPLTANAGLAVGVPVAGGDLCRHFDPTVHKSRRNLESSGGVSQVMTTRTMVAMSVGLLLLGGCTGARSTATPARTPLAASSARSLYLLDSQTTSWRLTPLDWATLRDIPGAASLGGRAEEVVASGDGSTLASLTGGTSTTAVTI